MAVEEFGVRYVVQGHQQALQQVKQFDQSLQTSGRSAVNAGRNFAQLGPAVEKGIGPMQKLGTVATTTFKGIETGVSIASGVILGGFVGAASAAVVAGIAMNAELEVSTLQFRTLLGSAAEAEKHVRSLFEFAKKTPFETGPIIQASRLLQTFGGDALNSSEKLTLIGDAAAGASVGFEEVAFWVGRAYAAIKGGQPFGEAAIRLQELALLTPETRTQMEALQKAGAGVDAVFGALERDLAKFAGSMELQANTLGGLTSTLSDTFKLTSAEVFEPLFQLFKDGLITIVEFTGSARFEEWALAARTQVEIVIQQFRDLLSTLDPAAFDELIGKLGEFEQAVGLVAGALLALGLKGAAAIIPFFGGLIPPIGLTAGALAGLVLSSEETREAFARLIQSVIDLLSVFKDADEAASVFEAALGVITQTLALIGNTAAATVKSLQLVIQEAENIPLIGEAFGVVGDALSELEEFLQKANEGWERINATLDDMLGKVEPTVRITEEQIVVMDALTASTTGATDGLGDFAVAEGDMGAAIEAGNQFLADMRDRFDEVRQQAENSKGEIDESAAVMGEFILVMSEGVETLRGLSEGTGEVTEAQFAFLDSLVAASQEVLNEGYSMLQLREALEASTLPAEAITYVMGELQANADSAAGSAETAAENVSGLGQAAGDAAPQIEDLGKKIDDLSKKLKGITNDETEETLALRASIATRESAISTIEAAAGGTENLTQAQKDEIAALEELNEADQANLDNLLASREAISAKALAERTELAPAEREVIAALIDATGASDEAKASYIDQAVAAGNLDDDLLTVAQTLLNQFGPSILSVIEQTDLFKSSSDDAKAAVRDLAESGADSMADLAHDRSWTETKLRLQEVRDTSSEAEDAIRRIPSKVEVDTTAAQREMDELRDSAREAARAVLAAGGKISTQQGLAITGQHGIWEVPGTRGAGDVVNARLAPGEAVLAPEVADLFRAALLKFSRPLAAAGAGSLAMAPRVSAAPVIQAANAVEGALASQVAAAAAPFSPQITVNAIDRSEIQALREELRTLAFELR